MHTKAQNSARLRILDTTVKKRKLQFMAVHKKKSSTCPYRQMVNVNSTDYEIKRKPRLSFASSQCITVGSRLAILDFLSFIHTNKQAENILLNVTEWLFKKKHTPRLAKLLSLPALLITCNKHFRCLCGLLKRSPQWPCIYSITHTHTVILNVRRMRIRERDQGLMLKHANTYSINNKAHLHFPTFKLSVHFSLSVTHL